MTSPIHPIITAARPEARHRAGFTLIEMMVAVAIMATLLVLFATMISHVSEISKTGQKRLDNDDAGRLALDIIGGDLSGRIVRDDLSTLMIEREGADPAHSQPTLAFLTEAPASPPSGSVVSAAPDTIAFVGYRLTNPSSGLERVSQQLTLQSLPQTPTPSQTNPLATLLAAPETQSQVIAPEVIRMEIEFVNRTNGIFMTEPPQGTNPILYVPSAYTSNSPTLSTLPGSALPDWKNVEAIVVTLVCIDQSTKGLASVSNKLPAIAASFVSPTGLSSNSVSAAWQSNSLSLRMPGLPAASIRIQTRTYPVP